VCSLLGSLGAASAFAQSGLNCVGSAVPSILRSEGVAERLGDIVLTCTSGTPGNIVGGNLVVFLNVPVTNRITPEGNLDVVLTVDTGSGPVSAGVPARLGGNNQVTFNGLNFNVPASGQVSFRISNLRGNVSTLTGGQQQQVIANLSFTAGQFISIPNNNFNVGFVQRSLVATVLNTLIARQQGSPLPENLTFNGFLAAGTRFSSVRVTEDAPSAFERRQPLSDTGTRIRIRYSNIPANARLFAPDLIAGSNATQPTAAGDFGGAVSGGQYTQSNRLLLARVVGADENGAGGQPVATGVIPTDVFTAVREAPVTSGIATLVYEVLDSDINARESAQIPSFLSVPAQGDAAIIQIPAQVSLAPVSTVALPSPSAPIPRYLAITPGNDCTVLNDCNANYLPRLSVDFPFLDITLPQGSPFVIRYGRIFNSGGNVLVWNATIQYRTGAPTGWVSVDPTSGIGQATLRLDITPGTLQPGVYEATLVIDAGTNAGSVQLPIRLTITPQQAPRPTITSAVNAATFQAGSLVPGSYGTLRGNNFGTNPTVTVDGTAATISFANAEQINFIVPGSLSTGRQAQIVVTSGGQASAAFNVNLAEAAPGIFNPGILNQDNFVNTPQNPALVSSVIQIFATGLLSPVTGTNPTPPVVRVKIHDRENLVPTFAGAAPGIPGVQQVNVRIPADLPAMTTEVLLCTETRAGQVCSPPVRLDLRR
jgi:uncharacterized protein (TIGR03437 family)